MAGLTPAERKALMDEMKNEKVLPPKGETKKNAEIFKEGMKPPVDPDMGSMQPAKKAKGGKVKGYDEGGLLEGMKDTYMEGVKKVGDDIQRIAGTEKGKQLDKEAQKEMYKRASNAGMKAAAQELKNDRVRAEAGRYKKGGSVKTASSRADGIAVRGKTRGKMY
jgi:hypothetical protein